MNTDYHDSSIADECSHGIKRRKKKNELDSRNNRRWKRRQATCN